MKRIWLALILSLFVWVDAAHATATVTQYALDTHGHKVSQTFLISRPTAISLGFGYCSSQSGCGISSDPDLPCYLNKYNPNFVDNFPDTITFSPLGDGTPARMFIKDGHVSGEDLKMGYYDKNTTQDWNSGILNNAPTFNADGSVTLKFNQGPIQAAKAFTKAASGRVCGLTAEEKTSFEQQYGSTFNNADSAAIKVSIDWQVDAPQYVNQYDQQITVNNKLQTTVQTVLPTPAPALTPSNTQQSNVQTTVPAAVTTLLNSLKTNGPAKTSYLPIPWLGVAYAAAPKYQLDTVQQTLTKNLVLTAAGTVDWGALTTYLGTTEKLALAESDVATMLRSVDSEATVNQVHPTKVAFVSYTAKESTGPREGALVVYGYNAASDQLIVADPTSGKSKLTTMKLSTLLEENPWLLLISHP